MVDPRVIIDASYADGVHDQCTHYSTAPKQGSETPAVAG
jgi:hypothetical protein